MRNNTIAEKINVSSLVLLVSLFFFTPFASFKKVIIIGAFLILWLLSSFALSGKTMKKAVPLFVILFSLMIIEFICSRSVNNHDLFRVFFTQHLLTYFWGILGVFYATKLELFKKGIPFIVAMISISCLYTIIGNIAFPGASRLLAGSEAEGSQTYEMLHSMHIGGYDFIYAIVFAVFPCALWIKKRLNFRFISVFFLTVMLGTLLVGSYFTSIILATVALIISLSSAQKLPRFLLIFGVLALIIFVCKNTLLHALIAFGEYIDSSMLQMRAQEMLEGSYQDEYDKSGMLSRIDRMNNAFYNIAQSPIVGRLFGKPMNAKISGHSELLAYFERYGLFGFIYLYYYYSIFKIITKRINTKEIKLLMKLFVVVFYVFLALNTFDIANATGCSVFLIAPCTFLYIEKWLNGKP